MWCVELLATGLFSIANAQGFGVVFLGLRVFRVPGSLLFRNLVSRFRFGRVWSLGVLGFGSLRALGFAGRWEGGRRLFQGSWIEDLGFRLPLRVWGLGLRV